MATRRSAKKRRRANVVDWYRDYRKWRHQRIKAAAAWERDRARMARERPKADTALAKAKAERKVAEAKAREARRRAAAQRYADRKATSTPVVASLRPATAAPVKTTTAPRRAPAKTAAAKTATKTPPAGMRKVTPPAVNGVLPANYAGLPPAQRAQYLRQHGLCGAETLDKSPCLNRKNSCPHH